MPLPAEYAALNAEDRLAADIAVFNVVAEHFRNDFKMVWDHSNFFLVVQGAFLSVFVSLVEKDSAPGVAIALGVVGFVLAGMWWWTVTGRMYLVEVWRDEMVNVDRRVDGLDIYSRVEQQVRENRWLDSTWVVSRFLPPIFLVSWLVLLGFAIARD